MFLISASFRNNSLNRGSMKSSSFFWRISRMTGIWDGWNDATCVIRSANVAWIRSGIAQNSVKKYTENQSWTNGIRFMKILTANRATSAEFGRSAKKFIALSVGDFDMPGNSFGRFQLDVAQKTRPTGKRVGFRMRRSRRRRWIKPNASHDSGLVPIN